MSKPGPLRQCEAEGCDRMSAYRYCHLHRRPIAVRTISPAELARRAREDAERNPLHRTEDQETR